MTLTAGAPLNVILHALERAGWGDLAGHDIRGVRGVLATLARSLNPSTGSGHMTVEQIASRSGYSKRWVATRLQYLEELGVLEWRRGGIVSGDPTPSWFRVNKQVVLAMVYAARDIRDVQLLALRAAYLARLATLRTQTVFPRRHKRRSMYVEPKPALPPSGKVPHREPSPTSTAARGAALARAALRDARSRQC